MKPTARRLRLSATLLSVVTGAALLTACGRDDDRTAGQRLDQAVASSERKADEVATDARRGLDSAAGAVASKSKDMAITAEVKSRLAKDEQLSALAINVDTEGGRVVLRGTAPDTAARSQAAQLARSVDGVVAVENELNVQRTN